MAIEGGDRPVILDNYNFCLLLEENEAIRRDFREKVSNGFYQVYIGDSTVFPVDAEGPNDPTIRQHEAKYWESTHAELRVLRPCFTIAAVIRPSLVLTWHPHTRDSASQNR